MREIKFRAWHEVEKKMFVNQRICFGGDGTFWVFGLGHEWQGEYIKLMQFTGLKDKNGKEIYEGDILDIIQYEGNGKEMARAKNKVRWNETEAKFDFAWTTNGLVGIGGSDLDIFLFNFRGRGKNQMDWYLDFEVIGNIYENPELLTN